MSHISRSGNTHVDSLATLATSSARELPRIILVEHLDRAGQVAKDMVCIHEVRVGPNLMDPIVKFLEDDILPEERSEVEKIRRNAPPFWLSEDHKLYKRSYSGPYLLCIYPETSELLLEELHEGICGSHTGGRSLSHRAKNTSRKVTSAKGLPRTSISQEEFSTLCPAYGRSPSGAWIL